MAGASTDPRNRTPRVLALIPALVALATVQLVAAAPASGAGTSPDFAQVWSVTEADAGAPIAESSPNIANLPGGPAVVVGDRSGHVYALGLTNGAQVAGWPFSTGGIPVDATPSVWSATAGGLDNVLVGVGNAAVSQAGGYQAISPQGGSEWFTQVQRVPGQSAVAGIQASMAIGRLEGLTATVAGSLGQETDALNAQSGAVLGGYPWFQADSVFSTPAIADLHGDGQNEIVEGGDSTAGIAYGVTYQNGGHLRVLSQTGNFATGNPSGGLICQYNTDQTVQSSPAVGRFLGGYGMGIAFGTSNYYGGVSTTNDVIAVDSHCNQMWVAKLDGDTSSSPALADVLGNDRLQVVEGTNNGGGGGSVWVLDGASGQTDWRASTTGQVMGSVVTADLAGQGYQDLIVPTTQGVDVFDGRSGQLETVLAGGDGFQNSPLVTMDPNGSVGITIAGYNNAFAGVVIHYEVQGTNTTGVYQPGAWPMFHHDPQLTGTSQMTWVPPQSAPNLLQDASFGSSLQGWRVSPGQNWAVYSSSTAPVGGRFLATNSGSSSSPSFYQDMAVTPAPGHSYQASVWLRSASSSAVPVAVVVWGVGGNTEVGQMNATLGSAWSRYSVDLDVANSGHVDLRFQIYFPTGPGIEVSGATVQGAGLADAGFQRGLGSWSVAPGQNFAVYHSNASPVSGSYLETNSGSSSGPNLYQDVDVAPAAGNDYHATVWLRASSSSPVSVSLVLWTLGGSTEVAQSDFTVSSTNWTPFTANLDVSSAGHSGLRLQLYFSTGVGLDVADASLQNAAIADSDFEQSGLGPWMVSPGANWADGRGSGAEAGTTWLLTNTGTGSSSNLYQDVATDVVAGRSYTGSVWLKSSGSPMPVTVVMWAAGGPYPTELGQTQATVGSSWQQVTTDVDVQHSGHTNLRFQIFLGAGPTLSVDQVSGPGLWPN